MTTFATCGRSQPSAAGLPTRSPDTATAADLRRFQLHQTQTGMQPPSINGAVAALRFFFTVTLDRPDLARRLTIVREPRRLPAVLSVAEVTLLLQAAPGPNAARSPPAPQANPRGPCRCRGRRDQEARVAAHAAAQLRHAPAGTGHRHPRHPEPAPAPVLCPASLARSSAGAW